MRKKYLHILGLDTQASEAEIKKAFRRKALLLHPDKNLDRDTQQEFINLCEAYQKLLDPASIEEETFQGDTSFYSRRYNRTITEEEFEARLQRARDYARSRALKEQNIRSISFQEVKNTYITPLSYWVCALSFIALLLIALDYLILKPNEKEGVLLDYFQDGYIMYYSVYDIDASAQKRKGNPAIKNSDVYIYLSQIMDHESFKRIDRNTMISVFQTPILHDILCFNLAGEPMEESVFNRKRFHFFFWLYFGVFIAPLITLLFRGANSFYIMFIYLTTYLTLLVLPVFIFNLVYFLW